MTRFRAACLLILSFVWGTGAVAEEARPARVEVTILQTTDLHGHLVAWDYSREKPDDVGLARVSTRVKEIRKERPNVLLLDSGDTIQGTPIEFLHARKKDGPDPTARVMNAMKYDAMAVGNHEFNFGLDVLRKAEKDSSFPWLSANTLKESDGTPAFREYLVKTYGGVRIGVLGLTTPNIPTWEPEANRPGLKWEDPVETAKRLIPILRGKERCDLVVVLVHSGLEVDLATGKPDDTAAENRVGAIAGGAHGIDLLLTGHTHRRIPLTRLSGVPILQPGRYGDVLGRVDVSFERDGDRWKLAGMDGKLLPSDASVVEDPEVVAIAKPYDEEARLYMGETIAVSDEAFPAARARLEDSALLDLINDVQLAVTGADLSMTSLLPGGTQYEGLPKGPVKVRDVYALYPYENQLIVLEIDGSVLKDVVERAAEFYGSATLAEGKLVLKPKEGMIPYNFDVVQGASYRIDPLAPVGSRVKELTVKGRPVQPSDRFTLAVNSYRARGAGGYAALRRGKTTRVIALEIRDLLIDEIKKRGRIAPRTDHSWGLEVRTEWSPDAFRSPAN